jgi:hypothetical protein
MSGFSSSQDSSAKLYCMTWRRQGASESFRHFVTADCLSHAIEQSKSEINLALASNSVLWVLQDCNRNQTEGLVVSLTPKAMSDWTGTLFGLSVSLLLSLGLILLFESLNPAVPPEQQFEGAVQLMPAKRPTVIPASVDDKDVVPCSVRGFVAAKKIIDVRAPRSGRLSIRSLGVGDRVMKGELIGEYDLVPNFTDAMLEPDSLPSSGDLRVSAETRITSPVTGLVIGVTSETQMNTVEGTPLVRLARASDLRIYVSIDKTKIDQHQVCYVWRSGTFLSIAEIILKEHNLDSTLSLRPLDEFASIVPGMTVDVECAPQTRQQISNSEQGIVQVQ